MNAGRGSGPLFSTRPRNTLREDGYAYAVIGKGGPREFYEKACGAIEIPGSDPGIFPTCCRIRDLGLCCCQLTGKFGRQCRKQRKQWAGSALREGGVCSHRGQLRSHQSRPERGHGHALAAQGWPAGGRVGPGKFSMWRRNGDLALELQRRCPDATVLGSDFVRDAPARRGLRETRVADAIDLPFEDGMFDVATAAFGLRNMENWKEGLVEMGRVVQEGARFWSSISRSRGDCFAGPMSST